MTGSGDRLLRELVAVAGELGADELGEVLSRAVAPVVAHEGVRLSGTTPSAAGGVHPLGFPHGYGADFDPACPPRGNGDAPVLRRVFVDHGELRLTLRDARGEWGSLSLVRARPFDADDVRRALDLGPWLIAALRAHVTGGPLAPSGPPDPPGVVVLGPDDRVRASTPAARRWQPRRAGHGTEWVGRLFLAALSAQARRHARDPRVPPALVHGPAATFGRWVAFHAQPTGTGDVAVVLQAASGTPLLPVFGDWYGITTRERQVIAELLDGAVPKQIARRLGVSAHTVHDHFKSIFRKTGADGRHHLVTALAG
ncbi:helix-turn-helix transcriptional regulator [Saccharothrix obliqua]|uniref:helix-turn-helix transcriptional regulator n=1 Tax=Saccharothrix obliqua TaxID=2861747 RepID=UPI001C5EFA53|nr:helix-turn-helix transcriptional regulator [Saccharothrix obliqua]MBW4718397.1 helix-turn-helix transcriptional regulator [Saccharothrix obliqua]